MVGIGDSEKHGLYQKEISTLWPNIIWLFIVINSHPLVCGTKKNCAIFLGPASSQH